MKVRVFYRCALCGANESVVREIEEGKDPAIYEYVLFKIEPHHCGRLLMGDVGQLPYFEEKGERFGRRTRIGFKVLEE